MKPDLLLAGAVESMYSRIVFQPSTGVTEIVVFGNQAREWL